MSANEMNEALLTSLAEEPELTIVDAEPAANVPLRRFYWANEARHIPPPRWLVSDLIPERGLVLLFGESSSGKSTIAVDLGMRIATGTKLMNRCCQRGMVLHVAGEDEAGLRLRLRAYEQRYGGVTDAAYAVIKGGLNLADSASVDALIDDVQAAGAERGEPAALVIIDTLARCAVMEENSSSAMSEVVAACDRIRERTRAAVLIVHHTGKDKEAGARGSSALRAAVDTEIAVKIKTDCRAVHVTKQRNGEAQIGWQFALCPLEVTQDEHGRSVTACYVDHLAEFRGAPFAKAKRGTGGKRQAQLREQLERQARELGRLDWTDDELREAAREAMKDAKGSSRASAVKGLKENGVLTQLPGGRYALVSAGHAGTNES